MADITQNSFDESNHFSKIEFQRGKDVADFELNESQDIGRVFLFRVLDKGLSLMAGQLVGSNDNGYKVTGTGAANQVTVGAGLSASAPGFLFPQGIPFIQETPATFTGLTSNPAGNPRYDIVWVRVEEQEVADPHQVPELGETTKRLQLIATLGVTAGVAAASPVDPAIPADSVANIWEGGVRYFKLARIARSAGSSIVNAGDVTDLRQRLPPALLDIITRQYPAVGALPKVLGNWTVTCGDGATSYGDFNGGNAISDACAFLDTIKAVGTNLTATIKVKPGTYLQTTSAQVPLGGKVTIEAYGARIRADAAISLFTLGQQTEMRFFGGTYDRNVATTNTMFSGYGMDRLVLQDLLVSGLMVNYELPSNSSDLAGPNLHIKDCVFRSPGTTVGGENYDASVLVNFGFEAVEGVLIENSVFYGAINRPIVRLAHNGVISATTGLIDYVRMNGCSFHPSISRSMDNDATIQNKFGTVIQLEGLDAEQSTFIGELSIENCHYENYDNGSPTGSQAPMFINTMAFNDAGGTEWKIDTMRLVNNHIVLNGDTTDWFTPPLYIGGRASDVFSGVPSSGSFVVNRLVVENLTIGYGDDTTFSGDISGAYCASTNHTITTRAAIHLGARVVEVDGIDFRNANTMNGRAALMVTAYDSCTVKGFTHVTSVATGSPTLTGAVVVLRAPTSCKVMDFSKFLINGNITGGNLNYGVLVEGPQSTREVKIHNGTVETLAGATGFAVVNGPFVHFDNVTVQSTASGIGYAENTAVNTLAGVRVTNCTLKDLTSVGVSIDIDTNGGLEAHMRNGYVSIRGNTIRNTTGVGVLCDIPGSAFGQGMAVDIQDNQTSLCSPGAGALQDVHMRLIVGDGLRYLSFFGNNMTKGSVFALGYLKFEGDTAITRRWRGLDWFNATVATFNAVQFALSTITASSELVQNQCGFKY